MIWLEINGGKKSERSLVEDAFWFALKKLMPRKKNLDVIINLTNIKDAEGYCHGAPGEEYEIEVQKGQSISDLMTTVFHEMVHVRQFERKQKMDDSLPYYERPYEIEAYKLQEELWKEYQNNLKLTKDTTIICCENLERRIKDLASTTALTGSLSKNLLKELSV